MSPACRFKQIDRQRARREDRRARRRQGRARRRADARRSRARLAAQARTPTASLPLLRLPAKTRRPRRDHARPPRGCATARPTWSFLGTGGSSLGGQTLAQLAGIACRASARFARPAAPAFHGQPRSRHLRRAARKAAARDHALRRDLEIRRHRRDADADHRRARPRCKQAGLEARIGELFLGLTEAAKAGQAQRPARSARVRRSRCSSTIPASAGAIRC